MCGIVGYIGPREAAPILLEGLARLEYRGYDSAGIALVTAAGVSLEFRCDGAAVAERSLLLASAAVLLSTSAPKLSVDDGLASFGGAP